MSYIETEPMANRRKYKCDEHGTYEPDFKSGFFKGGLGRPVCPVCAKRAVDEFLAKTETYLAG